MKKLLFAVFAHPDDEAFGPSGTLLLEAQSGAEVHLITLTSGQAGANPDAHQDLGAVRLEEWQASASIIGATATHHLGYTDGELHNQALIVIQQQLVTLIRDTASQQPVEIELMTMDDNGITGHIDHTVASRATRFAFEVLQAEGLPLTRLRCFCVTRAEFPISSTDWLYMPAGRLPEEIDETIDARSELVSIKQIIRCHYTQRHDGETHLATRGERVAINHFTVIQ